MQVARGERLCRVVLRCCRGTCLRVKRPGQAVRCGEVGWVVDKVRLGGHRSAAASHRWTTEVWIARVRNRHAETDFSPAHGGSADYNVVLVTHVHPSRHHRVQVGVVIVGVIRERWGVVALLAVLVELRWCGGSAAGVRHLWVLS